MNPERTQLPEMLQTPVTREAMTYTAHSAPNMQ